MTATRASTPRPVPERSVLPYLGLALVVFLATAVGVWLRKPHAGPPPVVGSSLAAEPEGVALSRSVAVDGRVMEFVKAFRSPDFLRDHAPEGQDFVVVQFRPLSENAGSLLPAVSAFTLTAGSEVYAIKSINLPNAGETTANGFAAFLVPRTSGPEFVLHLSDQQTIPLSLPAA